jgi:hypothetical protein
MHNEPLLLLITEPEMFRYKPLPPLFSNKECLLKLKQMTFRFRFAV